MTRLWAFGVFTGAFTSIAPFSIIDTSEITVMEVLMFIVLVGAGGFLTYLALDVVRRAE